MIKVIDWTLPLITVSEANKFEHWHKAAKRHSAQKAMITQKWLSERPRITLPCNVELTRIAPRKLDSDNLQIAFKWIRDGISSRIIFNSDEKGAGKVGRCDSDSRIGWTYYQEKALTPRSYAIRVCIYCAPNAQSDNVSLNTYDIVPHDVQIAIF